MVRQATTPLSTSTRLSLAPREGVRAALTAIGASGLLLMVGCEKKSDVCAKGVSVEIAGNHGHTAEVGAKEVQTGVGGVYPIGGTADHKHVVKLRDADMEALQKGEKVTQAASSVEAHTHELGLSCKP